MLLIYMWNRYAGIWLRIAYIQMCWDKHVKATYRNYDLFGGRDTKPLIGRNMICTFACFVVFVLLLLFSWLFSTTKKQHHRNMHSVRQFRMRVSACMNAFTRTLTIADNNFCWLQIIFGHEVHLHLWQLQLQSQLHNFYGKWTIYLDFHPIHCYFR